jgi:serine/threonine-protein kinase
MSDRAAQLAARLPERYAFRSVIGRGAAAYVVLADDLETKREVAVKILRPQVATVVGEKRFQREIEILRQLDHPNILPLLDHGAVQRLSLYLATPFVVGENLATRIKREKRLPVDDAAAVASQVASALDYAHGCGVIHRDIKPENILLSDGRVVVADFGISRAMAVDESTQITRTGVALGTPEYMSPEQILGVSALDARSDIYALGCVVYEMLAGSPPFTGATARDIFRGHRTKTPESIFAIRPEVPAAVDRAVMRSLAKERESRFASAGEFAGALLATGPAPYPANDD